MTLLKWTKDRPFWECPDDLDVAMLSDAMAALYRFLPEEESISFFQQCVEPERSEAVKICAVKACLTLIVDVQIPLPPCTTLAYPFFSKGWKLPWQRSVEPLKRKINDRLGRIFYVCSLSFVLMSSNERAFCRALTHVEARSTHTDRLARLPYGQERSGTRLRRCPTATC